MKKKIDDRNLILKVESLNEVINLKEDKRAKEALKIQISKICELLRHNHQILERIVENYIEKSLSSTNGIDFF